jgi:CubicO group peptidase (beta-lactamase class C family)
VRRLLDHTSGIKGATEIPGFGRLSRQTLPRDSLLPIIQSFPLEFEPGHALIYNNSAYILLGHIIEKVSGQSYEDYVEEHLFPLAGMDDSAYCSNTEVWTKRAHGYAPGQDGLQRAEYHDHTWPYSAGSLCSTVADLVSWNRALHGGRILSPEAYDMMIIPAPLEDSTPIRYAMGLSHYVGASGRLFRARRRDLRLPNPFPLLPRPGRDRGGALQHQRTARAGGRGRRHRRAPLRRRPAAGGGALGRRPGVAGGPLPGAFTALILHQSGQSQRAERVEG